MPDILRAVNLQDLVTDALPEDIHSGDRSLQDVWSEAYDPIITKRLLQEAAELFPDKNWQQPVAEAILRLLRRQGDRGHLGQELLIETLGWITDSPSDVPGAINQALPLVLQDEIFSSVDRTIEFTKDAWGEEAAALLAACTGVKRNTAARWLQGDPMAKRKYHRICSAVMLYLEASEYTDDAIAWMQTAESDGTSPLEKIAVSRHVGERWIPWEAKQSLRKLENL